MTLLAGVPLNIFPSSLDCRLSSDPGHLLTEQVRPGECALLADTPMQTHEALERPCHDKSEPAPAAVPSLLLCLCHVRVRHTWCWMEPPFCWLPTAHTTATAPAGGRQTGDTAAPGVGQRPPPTCPLPQQRLLSFGSMLYSNARPADNSSLSPQQQAALRHRSELGAETRGESGGPIT